MDTEDESHKDYYKVLEVDYDSTEEKIRLNYRRLALKWHPDKHKGDNAATAKFQEINEAYTVLSDPSKRLDYDLTGNCEIDKYTLREYLSRFKGMILTCNGLGIAHTSNMVAEDSIGINKEGKKIWIKSLKNINRRISIITFHNSGRAEELFRSKLGPQGLWLDWDSLTALETKKGVMTSNAFGYLNGQNLSVVPWDPGIKCWSREFIASHTDCSLCW